jgi:hypothetical protein
MVDHQLDHGGMDNNCAYFGQVRAGEQNSQACVRRSKDWEKLETHFDLLAIPELLTSNQIGL